MTAYVTKLGERVALVGFEPGPLSTRLFHELKDAALPVVYVDSWRARAALSVRLNNTARLIFCGSDSIILSTAKSYAVHAVRTMSKARDSSVVQRRTLQKTVRGLLETFGLVLGKRRRPAVIEADSSAAPSLASTAAATDRRRRSAAVTAASSFIE